MYMALLILNYFTCIIVGVLSKGVLSRGVLSREALARASFVELKEAKAASFQLRDLDFDLAVVRRA